MADAMPEQAVDVDELVGEGRARMDDLDVVDDQLIARLAGRAVWAGA